jgi:hypothetical protein
MRLARPALQIARAKLVVRFITRVRRFTSQLVRTGVGGGQLLPCHEIEEHTARSHERTRATYITDVPIVDTRSGARDQRHQPAVQCNQEFGDWSSPLTGVDKRVSRSC